MCRSLYILNIYSPGPDAVEHTELIYFSMSKHKVNLLEIGSISTARGVSLDYNASDS